MKALGLLVMGFLALIGAGSVVRNFQPPAFYVERIWSYSGWYACRPSGGGTDAPVYHLLGDTENHRLGVDKP